MPHCFESIMHKSSLHKGLLFSTPEIVSDEGVPRRSVIKSSCCTTLLPGNKGLPVNTSAKIQPMLQISIAGVYCKKV